MLAACLTALGCGGDDEGQPIPRLQAEQLESRLDEVEQRLGDGSTGVHGHRPGHRAGGRRDPGAACPRTWRPATPWASFDRLFALTSGDLRRAATHAADGHRRDRHRREHPPTVTETETSPADVPTDTGSTDDTGTNTTDTGGAAARPRDRRDAFPRAR